MARVPIRLYRLGIDVVVVESHEAFHADEAGACWLISKFADRQFVQGHVQGGAIKVGVGRGPLDEHDGKIGECAMSLTAKALGVYYYPPLKRIIDAICQQDLRGGGELLGIIRAANAMSRVNPQDPREMINWFAKGLEAIYEAEIGFYEAEQEFPRVVQWERLVRNERDIYLAIICSDSEHMAKVAFSKRAAIVLQRNSAGLTQIQAQDNIPLEEIYGWLQRHEPDGWHLKGRLLLNGSITYPNVPPSRCDMAKIEEVIRYFLED